jgi:hypothetical protein
MILALYLASFLASICVGHAGFVASLSHFYNTAIIAYVITVLTIL